MAIAAATVLATSAWAQHAGHGEGQPGEKAAPGSSGMSGATMGPGMMGQGMMGGGMMGGGMMGRGMMGHGMGPGAMLEDLALSEEQQSKVEKIHDEMRQKHWELMGRMMQEGNQMRDAFGAKGVDRAAAERAFKRMNELREQMFAARLDAHAKVEGLLAPEQRAKLRQRMRGGGMMMQCGPGA
jgi:Spy/CpxP family protein refolding chaperone